MRLVQKLRDFSEFVMMQHTLFSLPFIFVAMMVASYLNSGTGCFGWHLLALGVLATLFARNFAMGVNRYLDKDIDKLNPRTASRPSVDGRISPKAQLLFIALNGLMFMAVAAFVNKFALLLSPFILLFLASYSTFKRFSASAHLVLGLCLALAPLAGEVAVHASVSLWNLYLALGVAAWVAGFDLLYSLQDREFDKKMGLYSIPARFGIKATLWLSFVLHLFTIIFWGLFVKEAGLGSRGVAAVVLSGLILLGEHAIVHRSFENIPRAFFTLNGWLGIVFVILIALEVC